jgi:hypothetical protein
VKRAPAALALYALLVLAAFYPQSLRPQDTIAYVGDSLECAYMVAWNTRQLFTDPTHLFDANILYPSPRSLTFTDHRLLPSLAVGPIWALTGNSILAYNVAVALACLLAAMAGRRLARVLGTGPIAAWAAGALYGFHTYQINEAPRLHIVTHGFLTFALAELLVYLKTGERRRAWTTAGFMLLQGLSSNYMLLYGAFTLGLVTTIALVARPRVVAPRLLLLALAGAVAFVLFLPVAWPYIASAREQRFSRDLPEGMGLEHYLTTIPSNILYGKIGEARLQQRAAHFIGFLPLLLSVVAVATRRRDDPEEDKGLFAPRVWVPAAAALALLFIALSLGKDIDVLGHRVSPGPYRLVHRFVPGFQLVRIPERLGLVAMLFVALLAARGLSWIRGAGWPRAATLLAFAIPLEHLSPLPHTERIPVGRAIPEVYSYLARVPVQGAVEVPPGGEGLVRRETLDAYFSTVHWKPLVLGYTAYPPLLSRMMRRAAEDFPAAWSQQAFGRVGATTIVVHHGRRSRPTFESELAQAVAAGQLQREARFDGPAAHLFESQADEVFALVPPAPRPCAPWPRGHRLRDPRWTYRAKYGEAALAGDGDLGTSWVATEELVGDEFIEVAFDQPLAVAGVVLPMRRDTVFPTRFRIVGREPDGSEREVARYSDGHRLQLVDQLRNRTPDPALGFDLKGRTLAGFRIQVAEGGRSFDGWSMPELEVWVP